MKMIKASNNGWRTIYISLERGPEPDDEECQEMVELGEYESKESYLESWREYNAMPFRFYRISAGENEEGFRVLSINYRYAMEYDPRGYEGFHSSSRDKIHKLQIAINRDYLKTSGAVDRKTGMRSSKETPYQPLEKE